MALDPRFKVSCPTSERLQNNNRRNTLVDAISKVSGLDIDNQVINGLKTLTKTYNVASNLPIVGDGVKEVAAATGLPMPIGSIVERFNPGVANQAASAMSQIGEKLKQRSFKTNDIPQYLADLGNFGRLASRIISPTPTAQNEIELCGISPYATDLVAFGGVKQKFMFVAEFVFANASDALGYLGGTYGPSHTNGFAMFIKSFERPNITYNYEDINLYNLRSKVVKSMQYEPLNMVFYDDAQNRVMNFLHYYLMATSPMHRKSVDPSNPLLTEQHTMDYESDFKDFYATTGHVMTDPDSGNLPSIETIGPLAAIKLYHVYNFGQFINTYTFMRPRFHQIQFDDLSMESSDANTITLNFSYDILNISTGAFTDITDIKDKQFGKYTIREVKDATADSVLSNPSNTGGTSSNPISSGIGGIMDAAKKLF